MNVEVFGLLLAFVVPGIAGVVLVRSSGLLEHPASLLGYGYFLGWFLATLLLRLWDGAGFSLSFPGPVFLLLLLSAAVWHLSRVRPRAVSRTRPYTMRAWEWWLWVLLLAWLVVRLAGLAVEVMLLPLFPWDAWMNWAPKAKTWFETGGIQPFVSPAAWVQESRSAQVYTLGNPQAVDYPPLVPLVQTWMALGIGEWRDNWINLPWIGAGVALFLAFYGQARETGMTPLVAMLGAFLLVDVPYLSVHMALAGYADLWLAAYLMLAVLALMGWNRSREPGFLLLMAVCLAAVMETKLPGVVWSTLVVAALGITWSLRRAGHVILSGLVILVFVLAIVVVGIDIQIPLLGHLIVNDHLLQIPRVGRFDISYHDVWSYLEKDLLLRDSWHMMGWLLLILLLPVSLVVIRRNRMLWGGFLVMMGGLAFLALVFFFTRHYRALVDSTTFNRALLHLYPVIVLVMFNALAWGRRERNLAVSVDAPGKWRHTPVTRTGH